MKIIVIGDNHNLMDCRQKLGDWHQYIQLPSWEEARVHFQKGVVVFDFSPEMESLFSGLKEIGGVEMDIFLNTPKTSLLKLNLPEGLNRFYGFNGLPGFFSNTVLEVSVEKGAEPHAEKICQSLGVEFVIVQDQVGMVTPRVICMIINEAYFTYAEGTASREDIDLAMKLGTNYPFGPFEWASRIGIKHVYELLEAIWKDTGDIRYRICPLLKQEYESSFV